MNFSQLHDRIRQEILRRIDRGLLTGSLLAAQSGLRPSHISNFLRRKRKLSLAAIDRVLFALSLSVDDLIPQRYTNRSQGQSEYSEGEFNRVPLVSQDAAIHSPIIPHTVTKEVIQVPAGMIDQLRPRRTPARRDWQRFVAVRVSPSQAHALSPVLRPHSIVVLDRHYNSLVPYHPPSPNLYGIHSRNALVFRYVSLDSRHIVLRPYSLEHPVELIEIGEEASTADFIVGRVCFCISPL